MTDADLRAELLLTLREAAARESPLYDRLDEPEAAAAGWTVKDHVAHLAAWRREAVELLGAVQKGEAGHGFSDLDGHNAELHERHHAWPAERVRAEADASYADFLLAVEGCPTDKLAGTRPGSEGRVWTWVLGNGHEHVAEHLTMLALESGDVPAADAVQAWAHAAGASVPGNAARADYNLGCYYARARRTEEALPPLRRALEADPSLREWARSDPDLEGVRDLVST